MADTTGAARIRRRGALSTRARDAINEALNAYPIRGGAASLSFITGPAQIIRASGREEAEVEYRQFLIAVTVRLLRLAGAWCPGKWRGDKDQPVIFRIVAEAPSVPFVRMIATSGRSIQAVFDAAARGESNVGGKLSGGAEEHLHTLKMAFQIAVWCRYPRPRGE